MNLGNLFTPCVVTPSTVLSVNISAHFFALAGLNSCLSRICSKTNFISAAEIRIVLLKKKFLVG
jgi:hypothetical protein